MTRLAINGLGRIGRATLKIVLDDPSLRLVAADDIAPDAELAYLQVIDGDLVKVMSWYDNEWGYASQMVREAARIGAAA